MIICSDTANNSAGKNPHSKFAICLEPDYIKRKIKRKDPQVQQD